MSPTKAVMRVVVSLACVCATALAQEEFDLEPAEPAERRLLTERTLTLDGVSYLVRAEHVLYEGEHLTRLYHNPDGTTGEVPRERAFAIEVSLGPVGAAEEERWTALRVSAPRFEANMDVGFLVVPPVVGVGVRRVQGEDQLLIGDWSLSAHVHHCFVYAVDPEHRMQAVPVHWHIFSGMHHRRIPDSAEVYEQVRSDRLVASVPLGRWYFVDPDCRLFLSGDEDSIEITRGAWEQAYTIETKVFDLETEEVSTRAPSPEELGLFGPLELSGPPQRIDYSELPRTNPFGDDEPE